MHSTFNVWCGCGCVCRCPLVYVHVCEGMHDCLSRTDLIGNQELNWRRKFPQCVSMFSALMLRADELIVLDLFLYTVLISAAGRQSLMRENHNCPKKQIIMHWPERTPCCLYHWMKTLSYTQSNAPLLLYMNDRMEWNGMNENMNERINHWIHEEIIGNI